jgi:glycosidase
MFTKAPFFIVMVWLWLFPFMAKTQSPTLTPPPLADWAKNAVIYEVNIRQYTPEGTFAAFQKHLPRLQEMGVDVLWLMPIHPIGELNRKGSLGSYYAVKDYLDVNPEFGSKQDFKAMVQQAQSLGMKVIIDWVANHTAPDHVWAEQGLHSFYLTDSLGQLQPPGDTDWWDVADLNFDNDSMRILMADAMKYWVAEMGINGFRCDVAGWVPLDFWTYARQHMADYEPLFWLAEDEGVALHQVFDMSYAWEFHHLMNKWAAREIRQEDWKAYFEREKAYPPHAIRMNFTSNHDENSWNGTEMERMGRHYEAMAIVSHTLFGMPLIYSGQEAGLQKRLRFFDKDTIDWTDLPYAPFYQELNRLKQENQALWNGAYGSFPFFLSHDMGEDVVAYARVKGKHKVVVVLNFGQDHMNVVLNDRRVKGTYQVLFSSQKQKVGKRHRISLPPYSYQVLYITH